MKKILSLFLSLAFLTSSLVLVSKASSPGEGEEVNPSQHYQEIFEKDGFDVNQELDKYLQNIDQHLSYEEAEKIKSQMTLVRVQEQFDLDEENSLENNQEAQLFYFEELLRIEGTSIDQELHKYLEGLDQYLSPEEAAKIRQGILAVQTSLDQDLPLYISSDKTPILESSLKDQEKNSPIQPTRMAR